MQEPMRVMALSALVPASGFIAVVQDGTFSRRVLGPGTIVIREPPALFVAAMCDCLLFASRNADRHPGRALSDLPELDMKSA